MKLPRALFIPKVWAPEDPCTVCLRTPTSEADTYYETVLTPDEADMLSFWLRVDVMRARAYIETDRRVRVVRKV